LCTFRRGNSGFLRRNPCFFRRNLFFSLVSAEFRQKIREIIPATALARSLEKTALNAAARKHGMLLKHFRIEKTGFQKCLYYRFHFIGLHSRQTFNQSTQSVFIPLEIITVAVDSHKKFDDNNFGNKTMIYCDAGKLLVMEAVDV